MHDYIVVFSMLTIQPRQHSWIHIRHLPPPMDYVQDEWTREQVVASNLHSYRQAARRHADRPGQAGQGSACFLLADVGRGQAIAWYLCPTVVIHSVSKGARWTWLLAAQFLITNTHLHLRERFVINQWTMRWTTKISWASRPTLKRSISISCTAVPRTWQPLLFNYCRWC